jgi:hypothetical protein
VGNYSKQRMLGLLATATKERTERVGRKTEARFLEAVHSAESNVPMPEWVDSIELTKPNSAEDRDKIDAIVVTDIGKLFLQIKSSEKGAIKHFKKIARKDVRKKYIGVLVIRADDSVDEIRTSTWKILEDIHYKLISARATHE